ncbi:MAG: recombinase family protein, partial [Actinomycetota bacterium]|nr:recombinase family protein [Actinomycetota bacterium]
HPEVRVVVAHKLDRLTRNFTDSIKLEELGIQDRFVVSDFPTGPAGILARDVNLAVAKHYVNNLREEVKKGMAEKVAQGGWPHKAPLGYLNDKENHTLIVDPENAGHVRHAFKRYATGLVSLTMLADELYSMGLRSKGGRKVYRSNIDKILKNPVYCGHIRWKGELYAGAHEPLVSQALFDTVQETFAPNRTKNNAQKRSYVLRDFLYCSECGAKITAGTHKGLTYYRCTHGKGDCSQRAYTREEALMAEVAEVLDRIAITPDIVQALVEEARVREANALGASARDRGTLDAALAQNGVRSSALLDNLLDGVVTREAYAAKVAELGRERRTLEQRITALSDAPCDLSAQVEALALTGAGARIDFDAADDATKREVLAGVLCNLGVEDGHIASYQYKDPFGLLEMEPSGAFKNTWWAM